MQHGSQTLSIRRPRDIGIRKNVTIAGLIVCLVLQAGLFTSLYAASDDMSVEEVLRVGEEFGVIVGEVDEEIRQLLGLQKAEGVVVFEVIGGKPADLAGIKPRALIKEIDSVDINNLKDFGRVLKAALATENFTVATYEPPDPDNQGMSGGIQFHFVRRDQS